MNALVLARVVPAVALLPLGTWPVRLLLGLGAGLFLSAHVSVSIEISVLAVASEVALGALLGVLAGLPAHAAAGLRADGPEALAVAGPVFAWAVFFAVGGPVLWLVALGQSFAALPPAWPDVASLAQAGGGLFSAILLLGLPAWLTALILGPLAGLADRLGLARHGSTLLGLRPLITLLVMAALLPLLLDVLADLWRATLAGGSEPN